MAEATKQTAPQVTLREFELDTAIKVKTAKQKLPVGEWSRKAIIPMWLFWRLLPFLFRSQQWSNRIWRRREIKYALFAILLFAGIWVLFYAIMTWEHMALKVLKFFLAWVTSSLILNAYSVRWLQKDFSGLMETDAQIMLADAPDAIGVRFPIGWTPGKGWIWYGFRRAVDKPEVFPRHLAAFGADGSGQTAMAYNCIMNAFPQTEYKYFAKDFALFFFNLFLLRYRPPQRRIIHGLAPVVIVMNPSDAGIDFHELAEARGIIIYTTQIECERGIWYIWHELKRRRDAGDKTAPRILIVADDNIASAFIGRNTAMKNLETAIKDIVENGNRFNINLVIFCKPQFYEGKSQEQYRYRYDCAQYYTEVMREIKVKQGDSFERKVDSPPACVGLFHWKVRGKVYTLKGVEPNLAQMMHRIRSAHYTTAAFELQLQFAELNFPAFPEYERPAEQTKMKFDKEFFAKYGKEIERPFRRWRREQSQLHMQNLEIKPGDTPPEVGATEAFYQKHFAPGSANGNGANGKQQKQLELEKK